MDTKQFYNGFVNHCRRGEGDGMQHIVHNVSLAEEDNLYRGGTAHAILTQPHVKTI